MGKYKKELLFTLAVLAAAAGLWLATHAGRGTGTVAVVRYGDPQVEQRIDLSQNADYDIDTGTYTALHLWVCGDGSGNQLDLLYSDGTSTLYAHMSSRSVSQGQTVKQGQVVGRVGTTGSSTGNHLHFEVRVNGSRVDPVNYFKSKTLYVQSRGRKVQLKH